MTPMSINDNVSVIELSCIFFNIVEDIFATSSSAEFNKATKSSERSNPNTKRRKDYEIKGMRLDTRYILYNFYKPFNEALAHFLNDRRFDYGPF